MHKPAYMSYDTLVFKSVLTTQTLSYIWMKNKTVYIDGIAHKHVITMFHHILAEIIFTGLQSASEMMGHVETQHFLAAMPDQCRLAAVHPRMGQLLLRACDHIQRLLEGRDELASLGYFWHEARQARGDDLNALAGLAETLSRHLEELNALLSP